MLGEPYRLRLLQILEPGEKTVGELVSALDGNQPNVSKHLQMLHDAGLVGRRREGTSIYYGIADPMVFKLCDLVCQSAAEKAREEFDQLQAVSISSKRNKKAAKRQSWGANCIHRKRRFAISWMASEAAFTPLFRVPRPNAHKRCASLQPTETGVILATAKFAHRLMGNTISILVPHNP
ncbi:MAG: ArsR/SmtB family transcription factor [Acidobacteriaceae bacterium]